MSGNVKLGITAEMVALMRAERDNDALSSRFVGRKTRALAWVARHILPGTVNGVFEKRLALSAELHRYVREFAPEQVVELGAGVSTFGLEYARTHKNVVVIDTDLAPVVSYKQRVLNEACGSRGFRIPANYHLLPLDVFENNIYATTRAFLTRGKRTLLIAEGMTSYFTPMQYGGYMDRVVNFMKGTGAYYLSHEPLAHAKEGITSGIGGKALRGLVTVITGNRGHARFKSEAELRAKLEERGLNEVRTSVKNGNVVYLAGIK